MILCAGLEMLDNTAWVESLISCGLLWVPSYIGAYHCMEMLLLAFECMSVMFLVLLDCSCDDKVTRRYAF
jgi:hypothetical protein